MLQSGCNGVCLPTPLNPLKGSQRTIVVGGVPPLGGQGVAWEMDSGKN